MAVVLATVPFAAARLQAFEARGLVGVDYQTYLVFADRFFATGSMYLPWQLTDTYPQRPYWLPLPELPSLYPPHAILLFAPFLLLPSVSWWLVPGSVLLVAFLTWRPAPWTWPVLAALLLNIDSISAVVVGNTDMWMVAFVAGGLAFGWPGVLISLKPSLAPLALVGVRRRSWWVSALALAILAIPMSGHWLEYIGAMDNAELTIDYSLSSLGMMLAPVIAWLGRRPASLATNTDAEPAQTRLVVQ